MAARTKPKSKLVIVVANDQIEALSYSIPVKHDRMIVVVPAYERVVISKDEEVVAVYQTPNVTSHPQLWSTAAYIGGFTGLHVETLDKLVEDVPEGEPIDGPSEGE